MTRIRKSLSALLALALCALAACGGGSSDASAGGQDGESVPESQPAAAQQTPRTVALACTAGDSLNPYTCSSLQNYYLSGLLFDPLVALSPSFEAEGRIASEVSVSGDTCAVTLRADALFSDGSAVTAKDVVDSLRAAMSSARYSAQLSGIAEIQAAADDRVVITLSAPDVFFDRALCVPVIKSGTLANPVGCGRFVLSSTEENVLLPNPSYYNPVTGIDRIALVEAGTFDEQNYAVMFGQVDLIYSDLRSSAALGLGTGRRQVPLTNLVYVGVNRARWGFSDAAMAALSESAAREAVASQSYGGYALPVSTPVNPAYSAYSPSAWAPTVDAAQALDDAGLAAGEDGVRRWQGRRLSLTLLVGDGSDTRRAAADCLAEQWTALGIPVQVTEVPSAELPAYLAEGAYDLYLGETQVTPNWDIAGLLYPNDGFGTGTVYDATLSDGYFAVKRGESDLAAFAELFAARPAFFPIVYRRGAVCFFRSFAPNIVATQQDIFYNIADW